MIHGMFDSKKAAEAALPEVKKVLKYDETDPDYFFGTEIIEPGKVYPNGIVTERLNKSSIYD